MFGLLCQVVSRREVIYLQVQPFVLAKTVETMIPSVQLYKLAPNVRWIQVAEFREHVNVRCDIEGVFAGEDDQPGLFVVNSMYNPAARSSFLELYFRNSLQPLINQMKYVLHHPDEEVFKPGDYVTSQFKKKSNPDVYKLMGRILSWQAEGDDTYFTVFFVDSEVLEHMHATELEELPPRANTTSVDFMLDKRPHLRVQWS